MAANRNRSAGHKFETDTVDICKEIGFPHAVTSRSHDRYRDAKKVDIMNYDERNNGRMPYNFQCKTYASSLGYSTEYEKIEKLPNIVNVVLGRKTIKKGEKFFKEAEYAFLSLHDFKCMVKTINDLKTQLDGRNKEPVS